MGDRGKRQRTATSNLRPTITPEEPKDPPPSRLLGRTCRLRLVHQSDAWLTGTLLNYSGPHKQTCEIELHPLGAEAGAASSGAPRHVEKVHLSTQPVHVLDEVAWGPEGGAASAEGKAAETAGGGRCAAGLNNGIGSWVEGLVPQLLFTPLGPPELEAEDGSLMLAQSLVTDEHVWIKRQGTRPLSAHMLRRRTTDALKKAVESAVQQEITLTKGNVKNAKKGLVGKRLACFWPMDDAWYTGVVVGWDPKAGQHSVLYDDGCAPCAARACTRTHNDPHDSLTRRAFLHTPSRLTHYSHPLLPSFFGFARA